MTKAFLDYEIAEFVQVGDFGLARTASDSRNYSQWALLSPLFYEILSKETLANIILNRRASWGTRLRGKTPYLLPVGALCSISGSVFSVLSIFYYRSNLPKSGII